MPIGFLSWAFVLSIVVRCVLAVLVHDKNYLNSLRDILDDLLRFQIGWRSDFFLFARQLSIRARRGGAAEKSPLLFLSLWMLSFVVSFMLPCSSFRATIPSSCTACVVLVTPWSGPKKGDTSSCVLESGVVILSVVSTYIDSAFSHTKYDSSD